MYARVTTGSYNASDLDKIEQIFNQDLVPGFKKLAGFQSFQGGFDRGANRFVAISTWDTVEHANAAQTLRPQFETIGARFDPPQNFEITTTS
ncbi:MAG: hypothetical protein ACR2JC_03990 [Chloroflexota bacterium]|nr:MAG: hypothetical protein DLM70_07845 [Chloroflexota bacterium]